MLGSGNVFEAPKLMAAEDFAFMAAKIPATFLRLGVHNPASSQKYFVHTPTFRIDENALPVGTAALVTAAIAWMVEDN